MPTENPRVNITLEPQWQALLAELAHAEGKSISGLAKELMLEALELREDMALSALAEARELKTKKWLSHEQVWGIQKRKTKKRKR